MKSTALVANLRDTIARAAKLTGKEIEALATGPWISDYSDPVDSPQEYWQSQIELLDSWVEDGDEIFHLVVTARDTSRIFGGDVYWRMHGVPQYGETLYEYVNGVPQTLDLT